MLGLANLEKSRKRTNISDLYNFLNRESMERSDVFSLSLRTGHVGLAQSYISGGSDWVLGKFIYHEGSQTPKKAF